MYHLEVEYDDVALLEVDREGPICSRSVEVARNMTAAGRSLVSSQQVRHRNDNQSAVGLSHITEADPRSEDWQRKVDANFAMPTH